MSNQVIEKGLLIEKIFIILKDLGEDSTFVSALEKIYSHEEELLRPKLRLNKRNLSSGVSDVKMFQGYSDIIIDSIQNHKNYRKYSDPSGPREARKALAIVENSKFEQNDIYDAENFCITEGATGAISSLFTYLKNFFEAGEVIIPCPSYYLFKLSAIRNKLSFIEIKPKVNNSGTELIISINDILEKITPQTKMIILTQPNNPTGQIYSVDDIRKLLVEASKSNILVVFDELFSDLIMDQAYTFTPSDLIAYDIGLLENVICIKSYSKNRNIPGFRIGYLYSKNQKIINQIVKITEERVFSSIGSNFKELIILDSFYQSILLTSKYCKHSLLKSVGIVVRKFKKEEITFSDNIDVLEGYNKFYNYMVEIIEYYKNNFKVIKTSLQDEDIYIPDTKTAFNVLIRIKDLDNVNFFDFSLNLFIYYGTKIQVGPYFGFNQMLWEDKLGFWFRISFSVDPHLLEDAISKLFLCKREYLENKDKFIHFNKQFK